MAETQDEAQLAKSRRRAMRTAAILAVVAVAFYVAIFFIVSRRHP